MVAKAKSVAQASVTPVISVPVQKWKYQALIQSFAYAQDPRDGKEYLFCTQARTGGVGDIEDTHYHRHLLVGDKAVYLDSMLMKRGGHSQSFHVRISAAGNAWIWGAAETYSSKGKLLQSRVARFRYRPGTLTRAASDFHLINTGKGSAQAIASPAGSVVLRRGGRLTETYLECDEDDLLKGYYKPLRKFTRAKVGPGFYQGSCASKASVWVVNGTTDKAHKVHQHNWKAVPAGGLSISKVMAPTGPNTSSEPEGVCIIRGVLHVGKRFNSSARRVYQLFALKW